VAVIALVSGKGSPGVTTTLVALTKAWQASTGRSAIGLDLDPSGGDVASGPLLGSVPAGAGILALATDRSEPAADAVRAAAVMVDQAGSGLVPGVPDHARAGAIPLAWDVVASALGDLDASGVDVLLDSGRLDVGGASPAWIPDVDQGLLLVRPSLPWVTSARRVAASWPSSVPLGVVVVRSPSPYSSREVARAIDCPLLDELPFDPQSAAVHSEGARPGRRHERRTYFRGVHHLASTLAASAGTRSPALVNHSVGENAADPVITSQELGS